MSYSYDKFLRPLTTTDRNIQIIDNNGIVNYTVNPFSVLDIMISNNILKINLRSKRVISIPFSTTNESKLAISKLQEQLDYLKSKVPGFIDKQIENYVEDKISSVDVNWGNGLTYNSGTVSVGGILYNSLILNGGSNDLLLNEFDNIIFTSSVYDVMSDFVSIDSTDSVQVLADADITISAWGQLSLAGDSALISIGNTQGLVYYTDYSSGFVNRSLVDKEYVDNAVNSAIGSNNELSEILINGRDVDSFGYINDNSSNISINLNSRVLYNSTGVAVANWSSISGIQYLVDFTGTYTTYSLIHKEYVDLATASLFNYVNNSVDNATSSLFNYVDNSVLSATSSLINYVDNATASLISYIDAIPLSSGLTNSFQLKSGSGFESFGLKNSDSILLNKQYTVDVDPASIDNVFLGIGSGDNTTGSYNVFIGKDSGNLNSTGYSNVFIGYFAGNQNLTGLQNVYIGSNSGRNSCGSNNVFLGSSTGYNNTTGSSNSFLGYGTGYCNTSGYNNTFIGQGSGYYNILGYANTFIGQGSGLNNNACFNTFVGQQSGYYNTTGRFNVFMGNNSGYCNIDGISNVFIGRNSGQVGTQSGYNTFIGDQSGSNNKASCNTFVGANAGFFNETGSANSILGMYSGYNNITGCENTYIGTYTGYSGVGVNYNTFLGAFSGYQNTASNNTFIGHQSGYQNTSGSSNTFVGVNSGANVTEGCFNTIIGSYNGGGLTTGNNNTIIGANVLVSAATQSNIILADGQGNIKYHYDGTTNRLIDGLHVSGHTVLEEVSEVINNFSVSSSPVTYDFSTGANWYHSSVSTSYTANFTNVPVTEDRAITVTIIISQGVTAYVPNSVSINGTPVTIKWSGASTGNANQIDIVGFTFLRVGGTWIVLGQINTFV